MLKRHLITVDPGGSRAEIVMACGKLGRIRERYNSETNGRTSRWVAGDTWKGNAVAPTGFYATDEMHFYPDPRVSCARCIKVYIGEQE